MVFNGHIKKYKTQKSDLKEWNHCITISHFQMDWSNSLEIYRQVTYCKSPWIHPRYVMTPDFWIVVCTWIMFQDILNMEGESVKRRHDLIPVSKSVLLGIDLSSDLFSNWIKLVLLRRDFKPKLWSCSVIDRRSRTRHWSRAPSS